MCDTTRALLYDIHAVHIIYLVLYCAIEILMTEQEEF